LRRRGAEASLRPADQIAVRGKAGQTGVYAPEARPRHSSGDSLSSFSGIKLIVVQVSRSNEMAMSARRITRIRIVIRAIGECHQTSWVATPTFQTPYIC